MLDASTIERAAETYDTPLYLYDSDGLQARVGLLNRSFDAKLLYAVKANANVEILKALRPWIDGLDIASSGELDQALRVGFIPEQLSFAAPGKSVAALETAVDARVGCISVDSVAEIDTVARIARDRGTRSQVSLRINPSTKLHAFGVSMSGAPSVFGFDEECIDTAVAAIGRHRDVIECIGPHIYPGTQCLSPRALVRAFTAALDIAEAMSTRHGVKVTRINAGGGIGVPYRSADEPIDIAQLGRHMNRAFEKFRAAMGRNIEWVMELGRAVVAESGVYIARVVDRRVSRGRTFVVLEGGMNHFALPSRCEFDRVENVSRADAPLVQCTLTGPLCTPLDTFGSDVALADPRPGDLIALAAAGAYGYAFSPLLFLGHATPVEVMHDRGELRVIRARRTLDQLD